MSDSILEIRNLSKLKDKRVALVLKKTFNNFSLKEYIGVSNMVKGS